MIQTPTQTITSVTVTATTTTSLLGTYLAKVVGAVGAVTLAVDAIVGVTAVYVCHKDRKGL
jgi:hypothetical protein